jgi:hypothetical protein
MSADYWIDTDWSDPYDTSGEQCVYLYCSRAPECSWKTEACGFSFGMLDAAAADHEKETHGG